MKKILGLVLSLTIISGVCASVLAYVNDVTAEPIKATAAANRVAAVKAVMPKGVAKIDEASGVFIGKDAADKVIGYAAEGGDGGGYGGEIVLMVGFEKDKKTLVTYKTLKASETPGLGMKLNTPEFIGQFRGQDATTLKLKKKGGKIEAITSATITSKAVIKAIGDAAKKLKKAGK